MRIAEVDWGAARAAAVRRCRQAGADQEDAEDCAQEALTALFTAVRGRHGDLADPAAWAATVAYRRFVDVTRRRKRARDVIALVGEERVAEAAEHRVVAAAEARRVLGSIAKLPPVTRQVCAAIAQGDQVAEVATTLTISKRSAEGHLNRARTWLRRVAALAAAALCLPVRWPGKTVAGSISMAAVAATVVGVLVLPEPAAPSPPTADSPHVGRLPATITAEVGQVSYRGRGLGRSAVPGDRAPRTVSSCTGDQVSDAALRQSPRHRQVPVGVPRRIDDVGVPPVAGPEDMLEGPLSTQRPAALADEGAERAEELRGRPTLFQAG